MKLLFLYTFFLFGKAQFKPKQSDDSKAKTTLTLEWLGIQDKPFPTIIFSNGKIDLRKYGMAFGYVTTPEIINQLISAARKYPCETTGGTLKATLTGKKKETVFIKIKQLKKAASEMITICKKNHLDDAATDLGYLLSF